MYSHNLFHNQDAYYPTPDPLQGIVNLEFYGQRPWRPGKLSAEPPDPVLESNGIKALQFIEKMYNHSVSKSQINNFKELF